jgi:NADH-quinone oxidoreductase subunit J
VVNPVIVILTVLIMLLSLGMIFARSPISSAISLVGLMVALGGVYALIGAHFVAALQIIVYAGAVMVLFIFSIMLLNMEEEQQGEVDFASWKTYAALGVSLGLTGFLAVAFLNWSQESGIPTPDIYSVQKIKEIGGNVLSVSAVLFSQAYIQFELISLLLLVAIAGALVLAKRKVD